MSDIALAMPTIFLHEGGLVNNPNDPGGATNFGVSLRFLMKTGDLDNDGWQDGDVDHDGHVDIDDIKKMTPEDATKLYSLYFWSKYNYSKIIMQSIATKVFDLSINMGSVGAHKCLQRAVRAARGVKIDDDGVLGAVSFEVVNKTDLRDLLPALKSEAAGYYRSIKYNGSEDFLAGWLNRAYSDMVVA